MMETSASAPKTPTTIATVIVLSLAALLGYSAIFKGLDE